MIHRLDREGNLIWESVSMVSSTITCVPSYLAVHIKREQILLCHTSPTLLQHLTISLLRLLFVYKTF